jgi:hypothetical protein
MPLAGFEPTIPVFERAKTFHALDRTPTVTGPGIIVNYNRTNQKQKRTPSDHNQLAFQPKQQSTHSST